MVAYLHRLLSSLAVRLCLGVLLVVAVAAATAASLGTAAVDEKPQQKTSGGGIRGVARRNRNLGNVGTGGYCTDSSQCIQTTYCGSNNRCISMGSCTFDKDCSDPSNEFTYWAPSKCSRDGFTASWTCLGVICEQTCVVAPVTPPTIAPSKKPSASPTTASTTASPTDASPSPTIALITNSPSKKPSESPTASPTASPIASATAAPTVSPSKKPSASPSASATASPTVSATNSPSKRPSKSPTNSPTMTPSRGSVVTTAAPSKKPSAAPTTSPTLSNVTKAIKTTIECNLDWKNVIDGDDALKKVENEYWATYSYKDTYEYDGTKDTYVLTSTITYSADAMAKYKSVCNGDDLIWWEVNNDTTFSCEMKRGGIYAFDIAYNNLGNCWPKTEACAAYAVGVAAYVEELTKEASKGGNDYTCTAHSATTPTDDESVEVIEEEEEDDEEVPSSNRDGNDPSCAAYPTCANLVDDCCPTAEGVMLDCCYGIPSEAMVEGYP